MLQTLLCEVPNGTNAMYPTNQKLCYQGFGSYSIGFPASLVLPRLLLLPTECPVLAPLNLANHHIQCPLTHQEGARDEVVKGPAGLCECMAAMTRSFKNASLPSTCIPLPFFGACCGSMLT
jgi:hypothetical protein